MTIEIAPPSANAKVASSKEPSGTKAKSGSADSGPATKAPGFMSILAAVDEPASEGMTLVDDAGANGGSVLSDAVAKSKLSGGSVDTTTDAATMLAQALQWMGNPMGMPKQLGQDPALTGATVPASDVGVTKRQLSASLKTGVMAGDAAYSSVATGAQSASASNTVGQPRKAGKDVKDTAALQSAAVANTGNSTLEAGRADDRAMKLMAHDMLVKPELVKAEPVLQLVATMAKREEQTIHGAAKANAAMDVATSWGSAGAAVGGSTGYSSSAPVSDASALTPAFVAEQVSYWISNDVQNAEMKLQGLGDALVEVRISMVGNEAHVAFRTDEAQARDALENASAHLKEMLQRDGVVLSGVSVGTSNSGGAGGQERQPRQGGQKSVVVAEAPARGETRNWGTVQTGRALDLFV